MNDNADRPSSASSSGPQQAADHRSRLENMPLLTSDTDAGENLDGAQPDIEALRTLVDEVDGSGTAFQSVAVAAVQILEQALCYEREAAEAALSLGQQEKLSSMVDTVEQAVEVLRNGLSAQGTKVMHLCGGTETPPPADGQPWWFALTDALEVLEEGTGRMSSLTTAQPSGSPACRLSRLITDLLRDHHDALLLEADEWIS